MARETLRGASQLTDGVIHDPDMATRELVGTYADRLRQPEPKKRKETLDAPER